MHCLSWMKKTISVVYRDKLEAC